MISQLSKLIVFLVDQMGHMPFWRLTGAVLREKLALTQLMFRLACALFQTDRAYLLLLVLLKADLASAAHVQTTRGKLAVKVGRERFVRWDGLVWSLATLPMVLVFFVAGDSRRAEFWKDTARCVIFVRDASHISVFGLVLH